MLETVTRCWRRHELLRQNELANVTVFVGDVSKSLRLLTALRAQEELAVFETAAESTLQLATQWLRRTETANDLLACAFGVLAQALPDCAAELRADWQARSSAERKAWLERQIERQQLPQVRAALLWLESSLPPLAAAQPSDPLHELSSVCAWLPRALWPVPCHTPATATGLETCVDLALREPSLPLAAIVSEQMWPQLSAALEPGRAGLLERGVVQEAAAARPLKPTLATGAELLKAFVDAREAQERARQSPHDAQLLQQAQGWARALLFQLLEAEPVTRGLFEVDARASAVLPSEVDLACVSLRMAIEVDDPAQRRERRKDVLLQTHGFMVVRYFAGDVVEHSSEVLRSIVQLVLWRSPRSAP